MYAKLRVQNKTLSRIDQSYLLIAHCVSTYEIHSMLVACYGFVHGNDIVTNTYEIPVCLWHMPHGIILLATLKNNDNCYLLFEQPSSGHFHASTCVSSYLWFPSHDLLALTKSTHGHFSPRLEGTNASSISSSYLRS